MLSKFFTAEVKNSLYHSSLLLSGNFAAQMVSVLAYPVLTRLFSAFQYGEFSLFLSMVTILGILATGRLEYALMLPKNDEEAGDLKRIGIYWCITFSLACFLITIVLGQIGDLGHKIPGLYLIPVSVLLAGLAQFFTFHQNRQKKYKTLAKISVLQNFTAAGGKVIFGFLKFFRNGLIFATIISQCVATLVLAQGSWRSIFNKKPLSWVTLKKYAVFPKYRLPQTLINSLSTNLPVIFLTFYFSVAEAGYFALVSSIAIRLVNVGASSLYPVFYQKFTELSHQQKSPLSLYRKMAFLLLGIATILGVVVFILSGWMVPLVFGKAWVGAVVYVKIIMPWLILVFISYSFAFIADLFSLQKRMLGIEIIYFIIRVMALYLGFFMNNVYLSILFYSIGSFGIYLYVLLWYDKILRQGYMQFEKSLVLNSNFEK